ncbi:hypothetical protein IMZ48_36240 [Candidatus Bathyarchaeota archaeon]|nr:hypothetical protein [Candidatus Bathyarchaeota archaeon]
MQKAKEQGDYDPSRNRNNDSSLATPALSAPERDSTPALGSRPATAWISLATATAAPDPIPDPYCIE